MTALVKIGGAPFEVESWTVDEDATPLIVGDSTGGVGSVSITAPYVPNIYGLYGAEIELEDDIRGVWRGFVDTIEHSRDTGLWTIAGPSRLGKANIYNVQAKPFVGTLQNAVRYYLELAGIPETWWDIEPDIKDIRVMVPGWYGELWFMLKQMLSANGVEVSLTGGLIRFRRPRGLQVVGGFETGSQPSFGLTNVAKAVEVYCYVSNEIKNGVIYPPGAYNDTEEIISFTAGELQSFDLDLTASVSSITTPIQVTSLGKNDFSKSVFMVTTDDGRVITPAQWKAHGGFIQVDVQEDTRTLKLWLRGPVGIKERKSDADVALREAAIATSKAEVKSAQARVASLKTQILAAAGANYNTVLVQNTTPTTNKPKTVWVDPVGDKYEAKTWSTKDNGKTEQWLAKANLASLGAQIGRATDDLKEFEDDLKDLQKKEADDDVRDVTRFYLAGGAAEAPAGYERPQYPALRILGYGVDSKKELYTFPTGVPEDMTDNEVGITIDNPFIQSRKYVCDLGPGLAARYAMADITLSGDSVSIEPTGYNGSSGVMTYGEVQARFAGTMNSTVIASEPGANQDHQNRMWALSELNGYYNSIGNAAGARYFDPGTNNWYRIRQSTVTPENINWTGELDTTHRDMLPVYNGMTYQQVQDLNAGLTNMQVIGKGIAR